MKLSRDLWRAARSLINYAVALATAAAWTSLRDGASPRTRSTPNGRAKMHSSRLGRCSGGSCGWRSVARRRPGLTRARRPLRTAGRALDASPARPHTVRMPESNPADPTTPPPATDAPGEPAAEELDFDSLGGARDPWTPRSRYSTAPRRNYELLRRDLSADARDAHETNKRARRPRRAA